MHIDYVIMHAHSYIQCHFIQAHINTRGFQTLIKHMHIQTLSLPQRALGVGY